MSFAKFTAGRWLFIIYYIYLFVFSATLEFQDGLKQRLAAATDSERTDWMQAIRAASYDQLRAQMQRLREQIEKRRGNASGDVDVEMMRLQVGKEIGDLIEF